MSLDFSKRRIFICDGDLHYHIFSFTQSRTDSSIYISSPDFSIAKWLSISKSGTDTELRIIDSLDNGKLSIHGSGIVKITPNNQMLRYKGNFLLNSNDQISGTRHLITAQLAKPKYLPSSPYKKRKGDYEITTKQFKPLVIIFFAIPRVRRLLIKHNVAFNYHDLNCLPPETSFGFFDLELHCVFWFAYRTKYMDDWPNNPHISYHDGYLVPVIIGTGNKEFRIEYRNPNYELSKSEMTLSF